MTTPTNLPSGFEGLGAATDSVHKFEFTGDARSMWPLVLKNLLFNILTLSLYRFWGRTHVRRYIWENVRLKGDPLEYTGEGMELFIGFLVAIFVVFLPFAGLILWAQVLISQGNLPVGVAMMVATYFLLLWLMPFALYRAFKYRMSRTRWRGIRGAQIGSGVAYAFDAFSYTILSALTLGLLVPMMENRLWKHESNNRRFGSGKFYYEAGSGPLYGAYFAMIGLYFMGFIGFTIVAGGIVISSSVSFAPGSITGIATMLLGYVVLGFFAGLGMAIYAHKKLTYFWCHTGFGATRFRKVGFRFDGTLVDFVKLYIGNFLLLVVTLGIAFPITQMRFVRYVTSNLVMEGELDLGAIQQSSEEEPGYGEGLAEGFDMGTI